MEDYKKKYEQALERARKINNGDGVAAPSDYTICETIFPELKESEDERIRKECISIIDAWDKSCRLQGDYCEVASKCIAWLEKQGEQSKQHLYDIIIALWDLLDKIDTFSDLQIDDTNPDNPFRKIEHITQERHKFVKSDGYNLYIKGEQITDFKQGEQKPADNVEPKFKIGDIIRLKDGDGLEWTVEGVLNNGYYTIVCADRDDFIQLDNKWELVEQKFVAWSEEDEKMIQDIINDIAIAQEQVYCKSRCEDEINWLKSLRPQNWAKEDKERYISCLQRLSTGNPEQPETINSKWFKEHIYPQPTWKPSKEQIKGIECAIKTLQHQLNIGDKRLDSLYEDLKKLRGE